MSQHTSNHMALKSRVFKYLTHAGVSAGAFWYLITNTQGFQNINVMGRDVPVWAFGAGVGAAASMTADVAHLALTPHVSLSKAHKNPMTALMNPAIAGASFVAVEKFLVPSLGEEMPNSNAFIVGALSEMASQWVFNEEVAPTLDLQAEHDFDF